MDDPGESAVTPVIGTILVLAITVSGIAVALLLGTPVLQRLQDQAALEAMVGQFQEVRHAVNSMTVPETSRNPGLSLPGGTATLGSGSHVMVSTSHDGAFPDCDLQLRDWANWDDLLTVDLDLFECRTVVGVSGLCVADLVDAGAGEACFEVARFDGGLGTDVSINSETNALLDLGENLDPASDYRFQLTNGADPPVIYAESWLLHTDRLSWSMSSVAAHYEWGAVFAHEGNAAYLASHPAVTEPLDDASSYFLRLPSLQDSHGGALSGDAGHAVSLTLGGIHLRTNAADVRSLRLDFHGDVAQPWCTSFYIRNTLAPEFDGMYVTDMPTTSNECSPRPGLDLLSQEDDTYGVKFTRVSLPTFAFDLVQPVLNNARLQI